MTLETKFDIDDKVYFMKDNKVTSAAVREIKVYISPNMYLVPSIKVKYAIDPTDLSITYDESSLFRSKPELLDNL